MRSLDLWVLWKNYNGEKVPVSPLTNFMAIDRNKPEHWLPFDLAYQYYQKQDEVHGLGFILLSQTGIGVVDLDQNLEIAEWDMDTYTELSPSGKGVHIWCFADPHLLKNRKKIGKWEFYNGNPGTWFTTVTGNRLSSHSNLTNQTKRLIEVIGHVTTPVNGKPVVPEEFSDLLLSHKRISELWNFGNAYNRLGGTEAVDHSAADYALGCLLYKEGMSDEAITNVLREYRVRAVENGSPTDPAKMDRADYYEITISKIKESVQREVETWTTYSFGEIMDMPDPDWLIDQVIPDKSVGIMWGQFGTCKTFLGLDLAMKMVTGMDWFGRKLDHGSVLYVIGEGQGVLKPRLYAWNEFYHRPKRIFDLRFRPFSVQLTEESDISQVVSYVRYRMPKLKLLVIDTLSRSIVGADENEAQAMSVVVDNVTKLRDRLDCTCLLIHHSRKDAESMRGSSVLPGAIDFSLQVVQYAHRFMWDGQTHYEPFEGMYVLHCDKSRFAENFPSMLVTMHPHEKGLIPQYNPVIQGIIRRRKARVDFGIASWDLAQILCWDAEGLSPGTMETKLHGKHRRDKIAKVLDDIKNSNKADPAFFRKKARKTRKG